MSPTNKKEIEPMKKLICLLLSVLLLVGASVAMADSVKLKIATWTSNETQLALLGSFVDEFAQKKGIDIDYTFESLSGAEYSSLLLMDLQSNEAPDAFWIMESDIKAFIGAGLCAKLNDALTDYDPDDIDAGALSLWRDGDDIYAVPFSTSPFIMIYNKDLFEQAGLKDPNEYVAEGTWTWETFRECMKTIKEKTGVYGYMTVNNAGFADRTEMNLTPFVRGFGGDFWTDDLEVKIDSAESIAGVQFFHDMVFEDESVVPAGDQSNFFTGGAACTFNQISQLGNLKDVTWQWGVCKLPGDVSFLGQAAMSANANSKNAELAAELVAYMTSDTCAARVAQYWPPCRHSVLDSEDFLNSNAYLDADQMKNIVASSVLNSRAMSNNINSPSIKIETEILFDKLWTKDADIASILGEIAAVYRANLQ